MWVPLTEHPECQIVFNKLKTYLVMAPILEHPNKAKEHILDNNASGVSTGAIFSQLQNGQKKF